MVDFNKISYYDLKLEAMKGRLAAVVGRRDEFSRISRVIARHIHNNCILVGNSGVGKTALIHGWAQSTLLDENRSMLPIVQLEAESFASFGSAGTIPLQRYKEAFESLPPCVLVIDDFGGIVYNKPSAVHTMLQLLRPVAESGQVQLMLVMETKEHKWLENEQPNFLNFFETIPVKEQSHAEQLEILKNSQEWFRSKQAAGADDVLLELILQLVQRFAMLGQLPASAVKILDEVLALAQAEGRMQAAESDVYRVVSDKAGIPLSQLQVSEKEQLKNLERNLNSRIIGQPAALSRIASTIKRAKLGLKNPGRPLGSFLVLGPSGVGKTETAKFLAETVFGKSDSFIRIDMSEFGQEHTVARLIGSPAGYVGFDAGGGLTNAVKQEPYSLVLLDEIEKAHPKIFDIFLQILDDGRLTSGQGETIDFTQTIVMATSNMGVEEIIRGHETGEDVHSDSFFQQRLVPVLSKSFRLEFLNRFDAVLVFKPLTEPDLLEIAKLEIKKVEARVSRHNIKFKIDPSVLVRQIRNLADPRFGARPVKRFVETTCEDLISKKLLQ